MNQVRNSGSRNAYVYGNTVRRTDAGVPMRQPHRTDAGGPMRQPHRTNAGGPMRQPRRPDIRRQLQEPPKPKLRSEVLKNREKAHHMSMGYVMFLAAALITAGLILVNYVQLQAELINITKANAGMESDLNNMRIANEEEYNRIISSIDLEEVKRIAIGELGMIYAQEGQIHTYTNKSNDYMRQVTVGSK